MPGGFLPRPNIKVLLTILRHHHRPIRELPTRQRRERLLRRLRRLVFDIDLADAVVLAVAGGRTRHLDFEDRAILGAFFLDVLEDFYDC